MNGELCTLESGAFSLRLLSHPSWREFRMVAVRELDNLITVSILVARVEAKSIPTVKSAGLDAGSIYRSIASRSGGKALWNTAAKCVGVLPCLGALNGIFLVLACSGFSALNGRLTH